jgi:hypothetical protein
MQYKSILRIFLITILNILFVTTSYAEPKEQLAEELTTLYRAARKVISDNQGHINNAEIGDKGLSSNNVLKITKKNYTSAVGSDLDMSQNTESKQAMLDAIAKVMDENQSLINEKGKSLKGFLPAVFAREVATQFSTNMQGKMSIKLTAPKKYVRNRRNRPDKWEHNIIEKKFSNPDYPKGKSFSEKAAVKGKNSFRYILPEYYGKSCLSCHGEPKGEKDITGGKKEGGKLGELGGAISLVIFE